MRRDFYVDRSDGFVYDGLDWKDKRLDLADHRLWVLDRGRLHGRSPLRRVWSSPGSIITPRMSVIRGERDGSRRQVRAPAGPPDPPR
jgi:hypothetical protein